MHLASGRDACATARDASLLTPQTGYYDIIIYISSYCTPVYAGLSAAYAMSRSRRT